MFSFFYLRRSKKGMELSINFIVMLILAITLFIFGIVFATKFFGDAEKTRVQISQQTKEEIHNLLLQQNAQVAIFPETIDLQRGENEIVGVGILNTGETGVFTVKTDCKYLPKGKTAFEPCKVGVTAFYDATAQYTIEKNDDEVVPIDFLVKEKDSPTGKYVFTITINKGTEPYGFGSYKVYVNVK